MQNEETNDHCRSIRCLSGPVRRCVAAERASRGNTRTTEIAAQPEVPKTPEIKEIIMPEEKKADVTQSEPIHEVATDPGQAPPQTPLVSEAQTTPEQNATPPQEPEPAPALPDGVPDNMVYVPGFGWLESQGPNHCEYAEDMYENGNKIGSMG